MRKTMTRLFMAVLMVALLVSASIMSVSAANEGPTCDGKHEGWTALTGNTIKASGNYYLTANRTGANGLQVNSGVTATLCLCGHKLETTTNTVTVGRYSDQTDSKTGEVINPKGSAELTLVNCVTTGEENGILKRTTTTSDSNGRTITLFTGSTLNIGDNVHLDGATTDYVVLFNGASVVNMYGGSIRNNANTKWGIGQVGADAKFNLYGGEISGNTGTDNASNGGGGLRVNKGGTFNMTGGTLQGTGNMLYLLGADATANISGGTVKAASATGNAILANDGCTVNLSGGATVYGKLYNKGTWNITGGRFNNDPSAVAATGLDASAVLTNGLSTAYPYYLAGYTAGASDSCDHNHDGWLDICKTGNVTVAAGGHYYLGSDLSYTKIEIGEGNTAVICLNGHDITAAQLVLNITSGDVVVTNCADEVSVISNTEANKQSAFQVNGGGTVTMCDGVEITGTPREGVGIFGDTTFIMKGGVIKDCETSYSAVRVYKGKFVMDGGIISGNTCSGNGGGVQVAKDMAFTMNGGTISGNSAALGGAVYMAGGTFEMTGGTISGNSAPQGGAVYMAGGTFEMTGGTIGGADNVEVKDGVATLTEKTGNYATTNGGGVFVNGGMFKVSGDAQILNNRCDAGNKAGVHVAYSGDMEMTGATIAGPNNALYSLSTKTVTVSNSTIDGAVATGTVGRVIELTNVDVSGDVLAYGDIVISGGKFGGKVYIGTASAGTGTISVTGGQFSAKTDVNDLAGWLGEGVNMAEIWSDDSDYVYHAGVDGFYTTGEHMNFGSSLALGLYLNKSAEGYTASVSGGYEAEVVEVEDGAYVILAKGIAAKAMDEEITYTITNKAGEVLFCKTVSIREAAEAWAEDEAYTAMVTDMINYGREAQLAFLGEYKMDALGETETVARWTDVAEGSGVTPGHENNVAVTLSLKDQVELNVYVKGEVGVTKANAEYDIETANGITRISFNEIPVIEAGDAVQLTLSNDAEISFSITDYCALAKDGEQSALVNALLKYIESVYQFNKK